jgi:hypothetical protein
MEKQPGKTPIRNLRDTYKVSGFRVRAKIDSYEHDPPALALTLDRRSKKRCAADAGKFAAAFTTNAGDGRAISVAGIGKFISIFKCAV